MTKFSQKRIQAIRALERTLHEINFPRYAARVMREVRRKAEIYDRIRANSLRDARKIVFY
jgi:hypothetical protein